MLRDENRAGIFDRPWSRARRLSTTVFLLGVTAAVATLRGPARGSEEGIPSPKAATTHAGPSAPPLYLRDDRVGVVAFRPAAALRHTGTARLVPLIMVEESVGLAFSDLPKELHVDTTARGFIHLDRDAVEWVCFGLGFGRTKPDKEGHRMHTIEFGGLTVRTVAPFDWLAYLRQWHFDFTEVHEGGRAYYKVTGPLEKYLGYDGCVYLPDDRTIVLDQGRFIRKLVGPEAPPLPAFLRGPDWELACQGLLAVALTNQDGAFAKCYGIGEGRPDDAVVLSLFKGVDHWTFSLDDADAIVLRAAAACEDGVVSEGIARFIETNVQRLRVALDPANPQASTAEAGDRIMRMTRGLLENLRVEHKDRSVGLHADGFGTLAEFASLIEAKVKSEMNAHAQGEGPEGKKP